MPPLEDAARLCEALPEVTRGERHGSRTWFVGGKAFAWERCFSKADIKRFGDKTPPTGPIFAVRVEDLVEKQAGLAEGHRGVFTISHFDGYAALLIQLGRVGPKRLERLITEAWLAVAPRTTADAWLNRGD